MILDSSAYTSLVSSYTNSWIFFINVLIDKILLVKDRLHRVSIIAMKKRHEVVKTFNYI